MQDDSRPLERGVGPINFGTTQVPQEDGLNELDPLETFFMKGERVFFAAIFGGMLIFTLYNIYSYLWKAKMYGSWPLVFSYVVLLLFSSINTFYELYMGFRCGKHDCYTHLLVSIMPEYRVYFFSEQHKSYLVEISVMWKIRQQLLWGLGMSQLLIVSALAIKISSIQCYFSESYIKDPKRIAEKMNKAEARATRLNVLVTLTYLVSVAVVLTLSFPVMDVISQESYNAIHLSEVGITAGLLLMTLILLYPKIKKLIKVTGHGFERETKMLRRSVLFLEGSFFLRIVMTSLQMANFISMG